MAKRVVTVRLTDEEYEDLKARAEADDRSMESVIRRAVFPRDIAEVLKGHLDGAGLGVPVFVGKPPINKPNRPPSYTEQLRVSRGEKP